MKINMEYMSKRVSFYNQKDLRLSAIIDFPKNEPKAYAVYAPCFTCGKDILCANRLGKYLAANGIAVLRIDFTGIGNSEGKFEESTFSDNVSDIISAAQYLKKDFRAPKILIGHSFGGPAILMASLSLSVSHIITLNSPSSPKHLLKTFSYLREEIRLKGKISVIIGHKTVQLSETFMNDLENYPFENNIGYVKAETHIFHAIDDNEVPVEKGEALYQNLSCPKKFFALKNMNHLLDKKEFTDAVGEMIVSLF